MKSEGSVLLVYGMHCLSFMTNDNKLLYSLTFSHFLVLWPKEQLKQQARDCHFKDFQHSSLTHIDCLWFCLWLLIKLATFSLCPSMKQLATTGQGSRAG